MAGLNKIMIIGNLGRDPEMRYTPSGNSVTSFSVATNRTYTTSEGERRDETEWFNVSAWNKLAEQCNQFLTKGRRVYVEGRLKSRSYEGRDGKTRFVNEITAGHVLFLDQVSESNQGTDSTVPEIPESNTSTTDADDLPF
jgi:single-strand DNA-binding protein